MRIMLDTNLWSSIGDEGVAASFDALMTARGFDAGGNPADEQHSSYLVDCDLFLSADARYVSVLELVRSDAPFPIAESRLVSGDRTVPVLDRIGAAL